LFHRTVVEEKGVSFNIDVGVMINDLITSGEKGANTHQRAIM